ncbi:MAG: hypothetical protein QOK25_3103 [Thermoleophilaceae bacterium]|nr:hypothetical protein [Thermoleophilaceae bacterium]
MDQSEAQPRLRAVTQRVFGRGRDPYIGNDLGNANRLVGLGWLVYGVFAAAVLSLTPPGDVLASTGWAVGAAMVASSFAVGSTLMRWRWAGFNGLLFVSYAMVLLMSVLDGYAPAGGAAYHELYLPIGMIVAASHPVRRVLVFIVFLTATALGSFALADPPAGGLADFSARIGIWCACAALLLVMMAQLRKQRMTIRNEASHARELARTDVLTGLGNRRRLIEDLEALGPELAAGRTHHLALFDLDGFKAYNDTYGHPAGDALLRRLGEKLTAAVDGSGRAYRMGGDEFCVLGPASAGESSNLARRAAANLSEHGEGFSIRASYGSVVLPDETADSAEALRLADRRMYSHKNRGRSSAGRQTTDVLLTVLAERSPELRIHMRGVTELCAAVARRLELPEEQVTPLLQAASLHDIGKSAIPDAILNKPGPLDEDEWAFMRSHTVVGERILDAAPSLTQAARLVRSSHESFDGGGYPDGLAGEDIPLGSRIIATCDAYDAMVSDRPYRTAMSEEVAMAELLRCAGTQFDPAIVEAFEAVMAGQRSPHVATSVA